MKAAELISSAAFIIIGDKLVCIHLIFLSLTESGFDFRRVKISERGIWGISVNFSIGSGCSGSASLYGTMVGVQTETSTGE